ncbi:MAG: RDD family protein [Alphaproteobacteria bacterium]|jgi:uncharacterized RDD family membrane protein YckC|nr:RDD family protein [Alphaproteobacteria bacterium]MBT5654655.1 RDD family protein [Alphaproteobacteria bacterium]
MIYGGFWRRAVAAIVDGLILYLVAGLIHIVTGVPLGIHIAAYKSGQALSVVYSDPAIWIPTMCAILAHWLYYSCFISSKFQSSPGMMALRMKVTGYDGEGISFGRATGRYFASIISGAIAMLGYLMIAFTPRKQALHDYIAGTLVVRDSAVK